MKKMIINIIMKCQSNIRKISTMKMWNKYNKASEKWRRNEIIIIVIRSEENMKKMKESVIMKAKYENIIGKAKQINGNDSENDKRKKWK